MKEWLLEFSKTPVGMIVCIVVGVIVLTIIILANTSIGRKSLIKLSGLVNEAKVKSIKTDVEIDYFKEEQKQKLIEERDFYKKELAVVSNKNDELEKLVIACLSCINNSKVKEFVKNYKKLDTEKCDTDKILEEIDKVAKND